MACLDLQCFRCPSTDRGAAALSEVMGEGTLHHLDDLGLIDDHIGPAGMAAIARAIGACPALTRFRLDDNHIGDEGLAALSEALTRGAVPALEILGLGGNGIGDLGLDSLTRALWATDSALARLRWLGLSRNQITDEGVRAFSHVIGLGAMPQLGDIGLRSNAITDDGLKTFDRGHPCWAGAPAPPPSQP